MGATSPVRITHRPLDVGRALARVSGPDRGAIALFVGTVRDHHQGRRVTGIEYHAYRAMAEQVLRAISAEVGRRYATARVAIHHRVGRLAIGEASVVIAVAAAHRREALAGCAEAIERLKIEAPIWKKEFYEDGSAWIEGPTAPPRGT